MNKRIAVFLAALAAGLVCLLLARFIQADAIFIRLIFGIGVALSILGFSNALSAFITSRVSSGSRAKRIEENDERNVLIRDRAGSMTGRILLYILSACALISAFANFDLYVTLLFAGIVLLQGILGIGFTMYYEKRL